MNTQNLTIVIFGLSSETSRDAAVEIAKKGHKIALASRQKELLADVARQCKAQGAETFHLEVNLKLQNQVDEFARQVHEKFGSIDVWINNASETGELEQMPVDELNPVNDDSVLGYLYGARAALGYFRSQGYGKLVNVYSHIKDDSRPFSLANTTSHSAVSEMTSQMQQEIHEYDDIMVVMISNDSPSSAGEMLHQILQQVDLADSQQEDAVINARVRNIFWIGVAVAGVLAGAAAIYYRNRKSPITNFSQVKNLFAKPSF
jgi:NADP-dependent 3-hydroxy acid dehydrogenase YdfG